MSRIDTIDVSHVARAKDFRNGSVYVPFDFRGYPKFADVSKVTPLTITGYLQCVHCDFNDSGATCHLIPIRGPVFAACDCLVEDDDDVCGCTADINLEQSRGLDDLRVFFIIYAGDLRDSNMWELTGTISVCCILK